MPASSEVACWLALLTASSLKRQMAKQIIGSWCVSQERPLADLLALSIGDLCASLELSAQQAAELVQVLEQAPRQALLLEAWARQGMRVLTRCDSAYPEVWAEHLPEERLPYLLFYRGNPELLAESGFAFAGAAQSPVSEAVAMARAVGQMLAQEGFLLIEGYTSGLGRVALEATLEAGGQAVLISPMGLNHLAEVPALPAAIERGRVLLLSPYLPDMLYSETLARARLPLLCGLSEGVLLVAPGLEPGDWLAGRRAAIWEGSGDPGLQTWLAAEALPFHDVAAARERLFELLAGSGPAPASAPVPSPTPHPEPQDDLPPFADAETALEALGRSGNVPAILAKRLREIRLKD